MSVIRANRTAKPLNVPDIEQDPAERKRILNVLAQRRYRRKRKEHLKHLERSAGEGRTEDDSSDQQSNTSAICDTTSSFEEGALYPARDQLLVDPAIDSGHLGWLTDSTNQGFVGFDCLDPGTLEAFDASFSFPLPSLPSTPSISNSTVSTNNGLSSRPESVSDDALSFPDEVHLPMLELSLLRGTMAIAKRLQVDSVIWDINANSPFHNSPVARYPHLPKNLRPTMLQLRNSHHPVFDILPWPDVRDKLILVFSQPLHLRPPNARSPTALFDFVYDVEDPAEGIRIWGDDPYADKNWEIGEKVFSNWWWALNSRVLDRSNEMRRNRGATVLGQNRDVQELEEDQ